MLLSAVAIVTAEAQVKAGLGGPADADSARTAAVQKSHNDSLMSEMSDPEYIKVSLLVASPGFELYNPLGHAALRMQCPSKKVDTCYEFASMIDFETTLEFVSGTMEGAFKRLLTSDYIKRYRDEGRGIEELRLNLNPEQEVALWRKADEECDNDKGWRFDYLTTHCSTMVLWLVESSLCGEHIRYNDVAPQLIGTYRDAFALVQPQSQWAGLFWNTLLGVYRETPGDFKGHLYPPFLLTEWQKATLVDSLGNSRPLAIGMHTAMLKATKANKPVQPTPHTLFWIIIVAAIAATVWDYLRGYGIVSRIVDVSLFTLQVIFGLLLTYLLTLSQQVATGWNWLFLVFNPLPVIVWLMLRKRPRQMRVAYGIFTAVLVAYALCTPFSDQLSYSQVYLLMAGMAIRTFANGFVTCRNAVAAR